MNKSCIAMMPAIYQTNMISASSLNEQSAGRLVAPLGHIIQNPSKPVFALTP